MSRDGLQDVLEHTFQNPELIRAVRSFPGGDLSSASFERLEFLGDRVLGLLLAEHLFRCFPEAPEGELAPRLAVLGSGPVLAEIARDSGLVDALAPTHDEIRASERVSAAFVEAALGALYLDGGLPAAMPFFERYWSERVRSMIDPPEEPKTTLQEWADQRGKSAPSYQVVGIRGPDHRPRFHVRVTLNGKGTAEAWGPSKRGAEKEAAHRLLSRLRNTSG